jgi:3-oxoacyl-[acyl-carrier protein] reductase
VNPPLRVVVTGAANGIGAAIADRLLADGAVVVGLDVETAPRPHPLVATDLADPLARPAAIDEATRLLGGVDVLVNAAGIFREGSIRDSDPSDWAVVWAVDLEAPIDLMRLVAPGMTAQGFGRIVNVTSIHATLGQSECLAYDVAKAGLEAATRSAAIDLAEAGILVNAVAPGFVRTRMSLLADGTDETDSADFRSAYVERGRLPLRRAAEASEIASAVAFLASRDNTYATGQVLAVDGGLGTTF